jgi:2-polyprenyl-3-methyl-5-hydroxy-6-metoxy-1,4-benzoquinol methylase
MCFFFTPLQKKKKKKKIYSRCASLTGIDISKKMIDHARNHHQEQDLRLEFQQVDIMQSIDAREVFPDGFDKIFSFYCLHWIKDHQ